MRGNEGPRLAGRVHQPPAPPAAGLWELGLFLPAAMSLSIDEPANSRLFVVAGRSTSVSGRRRRLAWCRPALAERPPPLRAG